MIKIIFEVIIPIMALVILWSYVSSLGIGDNLNRIHPSARQLKKYYPKPKRSKNEIIGVKYLFWDGNNWTSPIQGTVWKDGVLMSHIDPNDNIDAGVYVYKGRQYATEYGNSGNVLWQVGIDADYSYVNHRTYIRAQRVYQIKLIG